MGTQRGPRGVDLLAYQLSNGLADLVNETTRDVSKVGDPALAVDSRNALTSLQPRNLKDAAQLIAQLLFDLVSDL